MTLRLSNILVLLCLAPLFSCVSPLPQRTPAADLPGNYLPLTIPVIAIGDTQEHEATGFPLHDNDGALDAYVEVAQRPPEQPLFGRRILEWVIENNPTEPLIHLGDVLDMSCESELIRIEKIVASARQAHVILPGNHDGLMFGIFNYNIFDQIVTGRKNKWDRGCRRATAEAGSLMEPTSGAALTKRGFIMEYVSKLASGPHSRISTISMPPSGEGKLAWRNADPQGFITAIQANLVGGRNFARSFVAQKLRLPPAIGAPKRVILLALDTNQVSDFVGLIDTLRGRSPGDIGHIQDDQIAVLTEWIEAARRDGDIVVFAGHHHWSQISWGSQNRLAPLMKRLDHPLVYVSAHTHRGFWAAHGVGGRSLLELNVSSLSDWPIAYRRIAFHYDAAANRIKVVGELLPNNGVTPQTDAALLSAWETATCTQAGVPLERLIENELSLVREQKASRGTLLGWLYEGLGEWCKSCQAKMYEHGGRYQDEMLTAIDEARNDLGDETFGSNMLQLPAFCNNQGPARCIASMRAERPEGLDATIALFRRKSLMVDTLSAHLDNIADRRAKAYFTCRAVRAAKTDFDLTPEKRNANRNESKRRMTDFFRIEATVGME